MSSLPALSPSLGTHLVASDAAAIEARWSEGSMSTAGHQAVGRSLPAPMPLSRSEERLLNLARVTRWLIFMLLAAELVPLLWILWPEGG